MNILSLDTSSSWGSVALARDSVICYISYLDIRVTHSERLMLQIDQCLVQSGLTVGDIDLIVVSNGPGSFTGLRIGLATVKGICLAKKIPVYPVNSLYALAYNCYGGDKDIVPFIDAKMNEVYCAVYGKDMREKVAPLNAKPEEFIDSIEHPAIIIGDGVNKYENLISKRADILTKGLAHQNFIIASSLIGLVFNEKIVADFDIDTISDLEPYYLRRSQAELKNNSHKIHKFK